MIELRGTVVSNVELKAPARNNLATAKSRNAARQSSSSTARRAPLFVIANAGFLAALAIIATIGWRVLRRPEKKHDQVATVDESYPPTVRPPAIFPADNGAPRKQWVVPAEAESDVVRDFNPVETREAFVRTILDSGPAQAWAGDAERALHEVTGAISEQMRSAVPDWADTLRGHGLHNGYDN